MMLRQAVHASVRLCSPRVQSAGGTDDASTFRRLFVLGSPTRVKDASGISIVIYQGRPEWP
jgi:hypothetical protein